MTSLALSLKECTPKERIFVKCRLEGMTQVAACAAAGIPNPRSNATKIEHKECVQKALVAGMQETADEVGFTRKDAHEMLESAYNNAATSAEQVQAVKEMIALHGLAAPKQLEVAHKHDHSGTVSLERLETAELMKLANLDQSLTLEGECEEVVKEDVKQLL